MADGYDGHVSRIRLDRTDEAILESLQTDGRRSFRAIARRIGVSEGTDSRFERRLWAPLPDPSTEVPRPRHPDEKRIDYEDAHAPTTEHLVQPARIGGIPARSPTAPR